MTTSQPLQYSRSDDVTGFGFVIEFAGKPQHSVSWPDGPALRYMEDELAEKGISFKPFKAVDEPLTMEELQSLWETTEPAPEDETVDDATDAIDDPTDVESAAEVAAGDPQPVESSHVFIPDTGATEAANIRAYLSANPESTNQEVIAALHEHGIEVASNQVNRARKQIEN